jgi:arylsulfatase A
MNITAGFINKIKKGVFSSIAVTIKWKTWILFAAAGLVLICFWGCASRQKTVRNEMPNIVLVLCDNLGYGDLKVYNPEAKQNTPRISQLASEGMTFHHAYAAAAVCSPSRAAVMTGCYPRRVGLDLAHKSQRPVLFPVSHFGLNPAETTMAEILKQRGYATMCIGKWHLGDQPEFLPTRQGFDQFFGIPYSDDMVENAKRGRPPLPLMRNESVIEAPVDVNLLTQRNTHEALRFIEENRNRPFFLYFPQITPGSTGSPPVAPDFRGLSGNGTWGDSVMELDWSTGQIMDKLSELGLTGRTLIIWTNDNGAPQWRPNASNLPLKGGAYSVAEGGMRMPFIARWPGAVEAGSKCMELITLMDLLPTFTALCAGKLPERKIDGDNITPLMFGENDSRSPYEAFGYYYIDQLQAVRSGEWKLYLPLPNKRTKFGAKSVNFDGELYNLITDPVEQNNLFGQRPDVVKRLLAFADDIRSDLGELDVKGQNVRPVGFVENPTPRVLNVRR